MLFADAKMGNFRITGSIALKLSTGNRTDFTLAIWYNKAKKPPQTEAASLNGSLWEPTPFY
jgi:hypothetical protein